jgi:hypothetical protein
MSKKRFLRFMFGGVFLYVAAFLVVHCTPTSWFRDVTDNNWTYSGNPSLDSIEFYGFWPLRQIYYRVTGVTSRHLAESLPIGMPDNMMDRK